MKFIKNLFNGIGNNQSDKSSANKLNRPVKILTAFDIAEKLKTDRRKLEKTFIDLGWTEKTSKGIIATQEGMTNGAQTKYHDMSKNKYVVWEENILTNIILKESLKD